MLDCNIFQCTFDDPKVDFGVSFMYVQWNKLVIVTLLPVRGNAILNKI